MISAQQQITPDWWRRSRVKYDFFISQLVIQEASAGDPSATARRLQLMSDIVLLELTHEARDFARELVEGVPLPEKAEVDGLHIVIAAATGMDFHLTWNCTHIANAKLRSSIDFLCSIRGYEPPIICTPEELMED